MKKKLMIAGFWMLLICPNLIFPFIKGQAAESTAEKRQLAEFPVFSVNTLTDYPKNIENYINDHAAFRNSFLSLNAAMNLKMFGYADAPDVLKGKDGWYFFIGGEALKDCLGTNRFSAGDLAYITDCIQKTGNYFRTRGIEFLVVLPPNKEGVYREFLPAGYEQVSEITKSEELSAYIQANSDIRVVDPKEYLKMNKDYTWYYKTDTHWNDAAGFVTSQMIIEALGGTPTPIADVTINYTSCPPGDLAGLFHMPEALNDDVSASVEGYLSDRITSLTDSGGNGSGGIVYAETPGAPDDRRIAIYRDSFGMAIANVLPRYFRNIDFYHWQSFNASLLTDRKPDVVIYEIAEREQGRIPDDMRVLAPEAFAE